MSRNNGFGAVCALTCSLKWKNCLHLETSLDKESTAKKVQRRIFWIYRYLYVRNNAVLFCFWVPYKGIRKLALERSIYRRIKRGRSCDRWLNILALANKFRFVVTELPNLFLLNEFIVFVPALSFLLNLDLIQLFTNSLVYFFAAQAGCH